MYGPLITEVVGKDGSNWAIFQSVVIWEVAHWEYNFCVNAIQKESIVLFIEFMLGNPTVTILMNMGFIQSQI